MARPAATPQAPHPRRFARSRILNVPASTPAVRSVANHHGYVTWSRLATTRPWTCRAGRDKLERLYRYICRPPVSEKRLFLTARGDIGYTLKTPYRDGTTHVIFEPLDFIARLACLCDARRQAALVPPPRLNLTRFHGVFAPNSPYRARITPARRGRGGKPKRPQPSEDRTPAEQRSAMRWAKRLKRVFQIPVPLVLGQANAGKNGAGGLFD